MTGTRVPKDRGVRTEIRPFAEDELESFHMAASARDQRLADVLLIVSWTGLRWSEPQEVRVRDFVRVPLPVLLVSRAAPVTSCTPPRSSDTVAWSTVAPGRRIHDLRHTAACLWLARGVDPGTVQAWMGHESIGTTNRYLHFLGTGADLAGLERLNATSGDTGGTHRRGADQ